MDEIQLMEETCLSQVIEILIDQDAFSGPALGIAKRLLTQGVDDLSTAQQHVYKKYILPHAEIDCARCGSPLVTSEVITALQECDEYCGWCRHQHEKLAYE